MKAGIPTGLAGYTKETDGDLCVPPVPSRGAAEQELERVKERLLDQLLREPPRPSFGSRYSTPRTKQRRSATTRTAEGDLPARPSV